MQLTILQIHYLRNIIQSAKVEYYIYTRNDENIITIWIKKLSDTAKDLNTIEVDADDENEYT